MRLISLLLPLVSQVCTYKILFFNPLHAQSHSKFLGSLSDILTDAGHNVTMIMPVLDESLINKTYLKSTKNPIILEPAAGVTEVLALRNDYYSKVWESPPFTLSTFWLFRKLININADACEHVINNSTLMDFLSKEKFDIAITEAMYFCFFGIMEVLKVPATIGTLSQVQVEPISDFIGETLTPSYVPWLGAGYSDNMTFTERMGNLFGGLFVDAFLKMLLGAEHKLFVNRYGPSFRSMKDIIGDMSYLFTNANPYINFPHPTLHKVVEVGGITLDLYKEQEKLNEYWNNILNEKEKTILISFGSLARSCEMPPNYKESMLKVFSTMSNVTFIWKYEEDSDIVDHLPNLHLTKWMPQAALLADPRLSVFLTHGGLGSTNELAYGGKPAVFVPLFSEQARNAAMMKRHDVALVLDRVDLKNPDTVINCLTTVLYEDKYTENARNLAEMLKNQPYDVKETFLKHVEFAAKFGKINNLDPHGRKMSLFKYYLVDVILFISVICLLLFIVFVVIVYYVVRCCRNRVIREKTE